MSTTVINASMSAVTDKPSADTFSSLYPAIVQCFGIILLGYVTGRAGWITSTQAKGINTFTTKFALPALLFSNMATLDWQQVEWHFLGAIFLSKASLFVLALLFTLLLYRPSHLGFSALMAIFVTQSNDFALGYPIVKAIYEKTQPQFLQYIYLIAPISLVVLNPIGFVLLEVHSARASEKTASSKKRLIFEVVKQICLNPILFMTASGIAANFAFNHKLPLLLDNLLTTLGQSFSACALFILGLSIVGKFSKSTRSLMMGSGLLIFVKLIVFPLLTMEITRALGCGSELNATSDYSMFAFLYGTFPTAPSVLLYANQYGTGVDMVATSLVLCTFVSAPLMFLSATLFGMQVFSLDYSSVLSQASFDVAVLAVVCCVALVLLFAVTRRLVLMPHTMVMIIALFQMLIAISSITTSAMKSPSEPELVWWEYGTFIMRTVGMLGVASMTVVSAATMYCMSCYSLCRALVVRSWLLCYGLGLPLLAAAFILIVGCKLGTPEHGIIMFGPVQLSVEVAVLAVNISLSISLLLLRHRRSAQLERYKHAAVVAAESNNNIGSEASSDISNKSYGSCTMSDIEDSYPLSITVQKRDGTGSKEDKKELIASIEDIVPFPSQTSNSPVLDERMCLLTSNCPAAQRRRCHGLLVKYDKQNGTGSDPSSNQDPQLGRLLVLLILLLLCQITVFLFDLWQLLITDLNDTGLFIEVEFLSAVLMIGQGFITFAIYGLDSKVVFAPLRRRVQKIISVLQDRRELKLSSETFLVCEQFRNHHMKNCLAAIGTKHRLKDNCFSGNLLVNWLIAAGLASDTTEAQIYGDHLLQGSVISVVKGDQEQFTNSTSIYKFRLNASKSMHASGLRLV